MEKKHIPRPVFVKGRLRERMESYKEHESPYTNDWIPQEVYQKESKEGFRSFLWRMGVLSALTKPFQS